MNKKVCVIGAGRWGKNHIKTLHSLGCLAGIVEANSDALPECKEKYPDVRTFASIRDAIKKDFDGFTVATPAETHFEIAEFIISHKRHLLVEKPLTLKAKKQDIMARPAWNGIRQKSMLNLRIWTYERQDDLQYRSSHSPFND